MVHCTMKCTNYVLVSFSMSVLFASSIHYANAIPCDFKIIENDPKYPMFALERINFTTLATTTTSVPEGLFECEDDGDDDFIDAKSANSTRSLQTPDNQYIFSVADYDDYEDEESTCQVSRRTIQPKALNNIYNKLMKVVNTASFVQSINIEQCLEKKEPCHIASGPPKGKKHICRQKHVRITLKAIQEGEGNVIVDEQFYYPSHCICEQVIVKKKKKPSGWSGRGKLKCKPVGAEYYPSKGQH